MTRFESLGLDTDGFVGGLGWDLIPKSLFFFFSKKIKNKKINPTLTRLRETHPSSYAGEREREREREREFEFMKS